MDKDRIVGSAKDFAGKVEGTVGGIAGDARTQAAGQVREATGTAQTCTARPKMRRAKLRMPPLTTQKTLTRTAAILSVTVRRQLRRRCRKTR